MNFMIEKEFDELFDFDKIGRRPRAPMSPQQISIDPLNQSDLNAYGSIAL